MRYTVYIIYMYVIHILYCTYMLLCSNRLWSVVDHNCPTYGASLFDAICDAAAASMYLLFAALAAVRSY